MANYLAIAAVAKTLMRLVEEQCPRDEFTSTPQFQLYQTHDFGTNLVSEGFSLMLWRVTINSARSRAPRVGPDGVLRRPSLPVDLHFMLTPWAGEAERQLRLMGWAMRFVEDNACIPANELNHSLTRRERVVFQPDEAVELFCDPPGLPDYLGLWDKYRSRWQTSVNYVARMVMIESDLAMRDEALVRTRDMRYGTPALAEATP
jgi:hypothetical protein